MSNSTKEPGVEVETVDIDSTEPTAGRRDPFPRYRSAELGLRNHWYAAFFSTELEEGKVRGEMILGERILFKRVEGQVYAIADRCPHRGAAFSARPECYTKNTVTCWFHGLTVDVRNGMVVQILTDPGSRYIGKLKHKTYLAQELNGVIFVFIGDMTPVPPLAHDLQPKFSRAKLAFHPVARNKIRANWRIAAENGFDAAHLYGHRHAGMFVGSGATMPLSTFPSSNAAIQVQDSAQGPWGVIKADDHSVWTAEVDGVRVNAVNWDEKNPPRAEGTQQTVVGLFMPCGLEVDWWPAPGVLHFEWFTPVDEDHHYYMIGHAKVVYSPQEEAEFHKRCVEEYIPLTWRASAGQTDPVGNGRTWGFNNFDAFGREQIHHVYQYEDFWRRERLIRPDAIIARWRALAEKRMRGMQTRGDWAKTHGWSPDGRDYDPKLNQ